MPGVAPVVVMGVCGSGKSTVASLLAQRLGRPFLEGDHLHSTRNVERMAAGISLTDTDRQGWLESIAKRLAQADSSGTGLVVSCSALKRQYRDLLRSNCPRLLLVHLRADRALLLERLSARTGHYMGSGMLDSQLEILEEPKPPERFLACEVDVPAYEVVDRVERWLASLDT